MKRVSVFLIMFALCCLCAGCIGSPQRVYYIGKEYTFGTVNIKAEHDDVQERFIIHYDISERDKHSHFFYFCFHYNMTSIKNSEQFEYFDENGFNVEFDANGDYIFYTSKTFYVSYKNANVDIKSTINNKECNLGFGVGLFIFYNGSDCVNNGDRTSS